METPNHIIICDSLAEVCGDGLAGYLCHAYCHAGHCTLEYRHRTFRMEEGCCLIIPSRSDLLRVVEESADFRVEVICITQQFIEVSTPQSNYGMRGHLLLFENPVMRLTPDQQVRCADNFARIRSRLAQTGHHFHREVLINAVQMMILDFFDFHSTLYGGSKISSQYHQIMERFLALLERGDSRRNREIGYYADQLCVSPKYLSEVCKKVSGLPAAYWITRYTALDISRQLRDRKRTLTDIAEEFGFSSLSHFSRYVQNNLGAKPTDFRE
ncbi:MAG: AraC family transcriptional regulator [Alloprevotella sp.]|nr:AraC family transcriptional regulator [Alloprevotella sp.]